LRIPEALSTFDRAFALAPRQPGLFGARVACLALMDGILHAERKASAAGRATIDLRELRLPQSLDEGKRHANAMAMGRLQAIIKLGAGNPVLPLPI
jgi:hypothetical protein